MRIMRMSSVETAEPEAEPRPSSFLMRASRVVMTSFSCLSSSSTKPIVATEERELGGTEVAIGDKAT